MAISLVGRDFATSQWTTEATRTFAALQDQPQVGGRAGRSSVAD